MILCVSSEAGIIIYMQRTQEENFAFFGAEMRPLSYQHVITSGQPVMTGRRLQTITCVKVCYLKPDPYDNEPKGHCEDARWVGWAVGPQAVEPQPNMHPRKEEGEKSGEE
jgi:hypothetical protein